ncbi:MAG: hypothetical protein WEH44_00900, partial [Pirellulaceae bacterium]
MKNIDFLPEIYTQNRVQRRAQAWWCLVAAAFAVIVLLAASTQWMIRHELEQELAELEPKYAEALKRQLQLQAVRQETERAEDVADLYAYLSHPWPRSQLLAGVIRPLPASVRLTEITITHEALPAGPPLTPTSSSSSGTKELPSPAGADLAALRTECDGRQTILSVVGTATTLSELHDYVDQLGKSPLIAAAHLKGVETAAAGSSAGEARFHLYVAVRPGYGQVGGPSLAVVPV